MNPFIVTITGPSCAGKSTLEDILQDFGFEPVVSTTTREPRTGDVHGRDYHFVSKTRFIAMIEDDSFVENVEFDGNFYGVTVEEIERVAAKGRPIVIVCEPNGRDQITEYCNKHGWGLHCVFVGNPDEVIARRFLERFDLGMESVIEKSQWETHMVANAKRLATMMSRERAWIVEAFFRIDTNKPFPYHCVLSEFNEDNGEAVAMRISNSFSEYAMKSELAA